MAKTNTKKSVFKKSLPLSKIARMIENDWININPSAKEYLDAMFSLNSVNDKYLLDSGRTIIIYFLSNAGSWSGPVAKVVKEHLKSLL